MNNYIHKSSSSDFEKAKLLSLFFWVWFYIYIIFYESSLELVKASVFVFFLLFLKRRNKKATDGCRRRSFPHLLFYISNLRNSLKRALKHLSLRSNSPQFFPKQKINARLQQSQNHAPSFTLKYFHFFLNVEI